MSSQSACELWLWLIEYPFFRFKKENFFLFFFIHFILYDDDAEEVARRRSDRLLGDITGHSGSQRGVHALVYTGSYNNLWLTHVCKSLSKSTATRHEYFHAYYYYSTKIRTVFIQIDVNLEQCISILMCTITTYTHAIRVFVQLVRMYELGRLLIAFTF